MDVWTSQSSPVKQILLSVACVLLGLVFVIGFRDFRASGTNATAGFLLGALLLVIGVAALLASGKQTVIVDPIARLITVADSNRFRSTRRSILFSDITAIRVAYLGKRWSYPTFYYLALTLRSGEEYPLFAPGRFFEGGSDRSVVASWKERLEEYLGSSGGTP